DLVFRDNPISNNTTLSIQSANETTTFSLSGNYFTDRGVYIQDDYSKMGYNLKVSHDVFENFKVTFSNILSSGSRNYNGGLAYWRNPIRPVYNDDGSYNLVGPSDYSHPMAITENREDETESTDVLAL